MSLLEVLVPGSPVAQAYGRVADARDLPAELCACDCGRAVAGMIRDTPNQAARLIAGWLSTREAIWWGLLCESQLLDLKLAEIKPPRLQAILNWVREPGDTTRVAVGQLADEPDNSSLGLLAQAVVYTTNNLSPVQNSPVACPGGLAHRLVALSVLSGANRWPEAERPACLRHFLELGLDVAEGKHLWTPGAIPLHPGLRPGSNVAKPKARIGNIWENW